MILIKFFFNFNLRGIANKNLNVEGRFSVSSYKNSSSERINSLPKIYLKSKFYFQGQVQNKKAFFIILGLKAKYRQGKSRNDLICHYLFAYYKKDKISPVV